MQVWMHQYMKIWDGYSVCSMFDLGRQRDFLRFAHIEAVMQGVGTDCPMPFRKQQPQSTLEWQHLC